MIVRRDTFPCIVTFRAAESTHDLTICRVVITADEVIVVQDGGSGPIIVFRDKIIGTATWNGSEGTVDTASGVSILYVKDSACGCGSRLRSWNPYRGIVNSSQDPTE